MSRTRPTCMTSKIKLLSVDGSLFLIICLFYFRIFLTCSRGQTFLFIDCNQCANIINVYTDMTNITMTICELISLLVCVGWYELIEITSQRFSHKTDPWYVFCMFHEIYNIYSLLSDMALKSVYMLGLFSRMAMHYQCSGTSYMLDEKALKPIGELYTNNYALYGVWFTYVSEALAPGFYETREHNPHSYASL